MASHGLPGPPTRERRAPSLQLPVQAHFLVYPARHAQRGEVMNFVRWLKDEAGSPAGRE